MRSLPARIGKLTLLGILAFVITVFTGGLWAGLLIINLKITPAIPWAAPLMVIVLWGTWRYLDGRGWPASTSEARRRHLRARSVPGRVFFTAVLAGALSIVALAGFWIVMFQLAKIPGNALPDFSAYPFLTVALVIVTASLVSSIAEEAGFRGYFQSALERELSGPAAILISTLAIAPAHALTQGFVWPTLLFYFFVDAMLGLSAYLTDSILPGIAVHSLGLLTFFTLVWPHDRTRRPVSEIGDMWFWVHVAQTILFAAPAIAAFIRLASITRESRLSTAE
jgi:membrane protease YdiL (CAAX protease family)